MIIITKSTSTMSIMMPTMMPITTATTMTSLMMTITSTPVSEADLSAVVPPSGTKVEARETDKALRAILKQLGV